MKLHLGDCIEELRKFPENSIDAIVTDPPYGWRFMGKAWDGKDIQEMTRVRSEQKQSNDKYDKVRQKRRIGSAENAGKYNLSIDSNQKFQEWTGLWAIEALRALKPGGHVLIFCGPRTYHRMACGVEDAGFEIRDQLQWLFGSGFPKSLNIGKQLIDFEGFGTALKPANEPILLARKPLSEKTVIENVLKWGTGGLNIDGCRVSGKLEGDPNRFAKTDGAEFVARFNIPPVVRNEGRFPANLILDETAAEMLDAQSGVRPGDSPNRKTRKKFAKTQFGFGDGSENGILTSGYTSGASRFFYVAKTSKRERGEGNNHPTVKPIKLMIYLCRLITPSKGVILDPFMGSGSTGIAALNENFDFIGIEKESEYFEIAKRRINRVTFDFI